MTARAFSNCGIKETRERERESVQTERGRESFATDGNNVLLLDLAIHKVPHKGRKPDDMIGAESLSERPKKGEVSRGDRQVWEPKN